LFVCLRFSNFFFEQFTAPEVWEFNPKDFKGSLLGEIIICPKYVLGVIKSDKEEFEKVTFVLVHFKEFVDLFFYR
jgi:ssRNA-specific RNase YbeY (16S rRNA maturation enzyme)